MRYAVDLRHPLQAPCGGDVSSRGGNRRHLSSRRGRGNVGIPKGFPKSVGRVGSRLHGFPCFPYSVISMACFSPGKCWMNRYAANQRNLPHSPPDDPGAHRMSLSDLAILLSLRIREATGTAYGWAGRRLVLPNRPAHQVRQLKMECNEPLQFH